MKHKHILLIVTRENRALQVDSAISLENRNRLVEICTGEDKIDAQFTCSELTVKMMAENGSVITFVAK